MATPPPGVYPEIPFSEYFKWDALSNSAIQQGRRSMAHLKAYRDAPPPDTPAFRLGRAVHCAVLEPERFPRAYVPFTLDRRTKAGKAEYAELEEAGKEILTPDEWVMCRAMYDSVWGHPKAKALLDCPGQAELSVRWNDAETDLPLKARWDRYSPEINGGAIVDLKTTRDARREAFERAIWDYGYHGQGGIYLEAAEALKVEAKHFIIIAVEKSPPYAVAVYRLTEGALQVGMDQVRPIIKRFCDCALADEWPAYGDEIQDIAIPVYAWRKAAEEEA